ncbi:hypothetical protein [Arthrobacter sp. TMN-50]
MDSGDGQHRYERPDNDAILLRRYGEKPGLAGPRVVLGPHAFLRG